MNSDETFTDEDEPSTDLAGELWSSVAVLTPGSERRYPQDWERLGRLIGAARTQQGMSRQAFAYAIGSSSKSVGRIEAGWIFTDPATAPAGDYNSEKYVMRRAAFIEMALEWAPGTVKGILDSPGRPCAPDATASVRTHEDILRRTARRL
ncbi:hypothetical protein ACFZAM_31475 [Streptomyces sp. NPDC008079]|uniref:hypothetical protein n=1 Tax=Streptomyces sp. NPDC008079 TaxID=3364806 RepID=UPI0036E42E3F